MLFTPIELALVIRLIEAHPQICCHISAIYNCSKYTNSKIFNTLKIFRVFFFALIYTSFQLAPFCPPSTHILRYHGRHLIFLYTECATSCQNVMARNRNK